MREIKLGEQTVRVRATALALLYYKQEFNADLVGNLTKMEEMKDDPSKLDTVQMLQMAWAMAKADVFPNQFPSFTEWIATIERIDIADPSFFLAILEEASDGFFRSGVKGAIQKR